MYIDRKELLEKTNGGLQIFFDFFPQIEKAVKNKEQNFKMHDEKNPSSSIKQTEDGIYIVTDWSGEGKSMNAIDWVVRATGRPWKEVLYDLAAKYGICALTPTANRPRIESHPALDDEKGVCKLILEKEIPEELLKALGPFATREICAKYGFYAVKSYTIVSTDKKTEARTAWVKYPTPTFPIFAVHLEGESYKILQPMAFEKKDRFLFIGGRPKGFVNGYEQLAEANRVFEEDQRSDDSHKGEILHYPEAILVSGERDAINVAGMGFKPVWLNSETGQLDYETYRQIKACCQKLYICFDADEVGRHKENAIGLRFLDIYHLRLPNYLANHRDPWRGRKCKDLLDWCQISGSIPEFRKMIDSAVQFQFWTAIVNDKGRFTYKMNVPHLLAFLSAHGFGSYEYTEGVYKTVYQDPNNVVEIKTADQIRKFMLEYTKDNSLPVGVQNIVTPPEAVSDPLLYLLPDVNPDMQIADEKSQIFFFENGVFRVDQDGITKINPKENHVCVWKHKIIKHNLIDLEAPLDIEEVSKGNFKIDIKKLESNFFKYLIQTSRIYWREELENKLEELSPEEQEKYKEEHKFEIDSPLLSESQREEQRAHLANKIFCIGYLMHKYNEQSKAWLLYATDSKLGAATKSSGGTGKSFFFAVLEKFLISDTVPSRNTNNLSNVHMWERITPMTDFVHFEDMNPDANLDILYTEVTGKLLVNQKNVQSRVIEFEKKPKLVVSSNFPIKKIEGSTSRRVLYMAFSDYYHEKVRDEITGLDSYRETRKIFHDFGRDICVNNNNYSEKEWSADVNFILYCLSFYLKYSRSGEKLSPPMQEIERRALLMNVSERFDVWATDYYVYSKNANRRISREIVYEAFLRETQIKDVNKVRFKDKLAMWAKLHDYVFNPPSMRGKDGRIIGKENNTTVEFFYIDVPVEVLEAVGSEEIDTLSVDKESDNKIPF